MSIMSVTTCCMSADDPPPTLPLFKAYAALLASTITNASRGRWASVASAVTARSTLSTVHNSACAELSSRCAPWPLPSQEKESHSLLLAAPNAPQKPPPPSDCSPLASVTTTRTRCGSAWRDRALKIGRFTERSPWAQPRKVLDHHVSSWMASRTAGGGRVTFKRDQTPEPPEPRASLDDYL